MPKIIGGAALAAILSLAMPAYGQSQPEPPPPPPAEEVQPAEPQPEVVEEAPPAPEDAPPAQTEPAPAAQERPPAEDPAVLSDAASAAYKRRESLPSVNLYLPEGQASIRLRKLIRNTLFESQIDYEFVNGDISTFLRYKYYARNYTYRLGVFDSIEFPDLTSGGDQDYERVRGGLFLVGVPNDYNNRWFFLLQNDQLTFGDLTRPDNQTSNIYAKVGYQFGTQFDERMNAIVGEQRGRITPVLTAFREIGPQRTGLAAAITQATDVWSADYQYTKFEAEGIRRFDITSTSFVFSRLHVGSFLSHDTADPLPEPIDRDGDGIPEEIPEWQRHAVPQYELFRLGGREALKSVSTNDASIGLHEVHLTNELFVPVFRNRDFKLGPLYWNTMYAIGYLGAGSVGFETGDLVDTDRFVADVGLGTESAIVYRDWDVFLTVIVAHTLNEPEEIDGGTRVRFAVRTVR